MKNSIFLLVLVQLLFTACKKDNFLEGELPTEAMPLLERAIADEACKGIAAGYSIDGEIQWKGGAGHSDAATEKAFTASTLTRIASIAKPMTAIAIMQLYEQGKIDLDAPIQDYLPEFPTKEEGVITTRHLLNHASGIDAYQSDDERENEKNYPTLDEALNIFKDRPLLSVPGTAYNYTTYGYVVLGRIIEKVSDSSYEAYMQQNIWDKAEMTNTGVEYANIAYLNKTELFHRNDRGKIKTATPTNISDRVPGGGLYSCVTDMLKFGDAVLNHSLIKESTLEEMLVNTGLKKEGNPYGLGWFLYGEHQKYGTIFGHAGGQTGASTLFFILPEEKTSIVVLSNTSGAIAEVSKICSLFIDIAGAE